MNIKDYCRVEVDLSAQLVFKVPSDGDKEFLRRQEAQNQLNIAVEQLRAQIEDVLNGRHNMLPDDLKDAGV